MQPRIVAALYVLATPFMWVAIGFLWIFLFTICLVALVTPDFLGFIFDTDPDPPGKEEGGPLEGRLSRYGIV